MVNHEMYKYDCRDCRCEATTNIDSSLDEINIRNKFNFKSTCEDIADCECLLNPYLSRL